VARKVKKSHSSTYLKFSCFLKKDRTMTCPELHIKRTAKFTCVVRLLTKQKTICLHPLRMYHFAACQHDFLLRGYGCVFVNKKLLEMLIRKQAQVYFIFTIWEECRNVYSQVIYKWNIVLVKTNLLHAHFLLANISLY
jgi:hypothetical protein